jgi:hypothetical protein
MQSSDEKEVIDLPPGEWRSDRPNPHEPFFGTGLWPAVAWFIGAATMFTAIHLALGK